MANSATNTIQITINSKSHQNKKFCNKLYDEMNEFLVEVESNHIDDIDFNVVECYFYSKWREPENFLVSLCNKYDLKIIGVCYEFGCGYVNSFNYGKNK